MKPWKKCLVQFCSNPLQLDRPNYANQKNHRTFGAIMANRDIAH